ncbi:MAG: hypothetical protein DRN20_05360, partial [Thermoplasmata archaeon]
MIKDIITHIRKTPFVIKIISIVLVFLMTAYAYVSLVSGTPPTAVVTPSKIIISPGESVEFDATESTPKGKLVYTWHFHDGSAAVSGSDKGKVGHAFTMEGVYCVTLFVKAPNGKMNMATSEVIVRNLAPIIVLNQEAYVVNEDESILFDASGSYDPDGTITSYEWDFGDGYRGEGECVTHTYKRCGTYIVNLTVRDNLGKCVFKNIMVQVKNPAPHADIGDVYTVNEGMPVYLNASQSWDTPSDMGGLRHLWSNGYRGRMAMEFYEDDGAYYPYVTVKDDDSAENTAIGEVNVQNTPPMIAVDGAYIKGNLTFRIAGEKWHNVEFWLYESGVLKGYVNLTRYPGCPQEATISDIIFDLSEKWEVYAHYTPDDDPINGNKNGASPAWIILEFEKGAYRKIHHTFNVRHPETYNWSVTLNSYFFTTEDCEYCKCALNPLIHFSYRLYDYGADDLIVNWSFADYYYEEKFEASEFPNFVVAQLNYTPSIIGNISVTVVDD